MIKSSRFRRLLFFVAAYTVLVLTFIVDKALFMLFHHRASGEAGLGNFLRVLWHGLPMDLSMGGYFMVIPGLTLLVSLFRVRGLKRFLRIYFLVVCAAIAFTAIPDIVLYGFWGFKIDRTAYSYLAHPQLVLANVPLWWALGGVIVMLFHTFVQYRLVLCTVLPQFPVCRASNPLRRLPVGLLLLGCLFLPIRGGVSTATMNINRVYFSDRMFLNHAAVNPLFSVLSSLELRDDFARQYRFFPDAEAHRLFEASLPAASDSVPELLAEKRPNIVFIVLESFSRFAIQPSVVEQGVTPELLRIAGESIVFSGMYANSFRTDRGLTAVLAGYPAQPMLSIVKYPKKTENLCSIQRSLKEAGYKTSMLYGGDLNFAHIKTLFNAQGTSDITMDRDFPMEHRLSKWGAPDHITFAHLCSQIDAETSTPYLKMFLTLSSHEPFEAPMHRFDNPYLNTVAYTDSCIGAFIRYMKQRPDWNRTLIILVPDHKMFYPSGVEYFAPERHDIFMLWTGGAIKQPANISAICSQSDIAATLLAQMDIDASGFRFSRNILAQSPPNFAFYTFPDGFGVVAPDGAAVYDCKAETVILRRGADTDSLLARGKAWLQCLFDDIAQK
ncbi:MAG: sulfatase-like hydrolase/transferase [Bacteroidales bacterium]|jgi:phosphoglycerol transferase MdoB-like AlkP superfamily enzyme|nr:sulfatase-like hydrolase/transferase [Bacteroidales bacterium]